MILTVNWLNLSRVIQAPVTILTPVYFLLNLTEQHSSPETILVQPSQFIYVYRFLTKTCFGLLLRHTEDLGRPVHLHSLIRVLEGHSFGSQ